MAERRRNPLTNEWVIVSPGRVQRPWQGEQDGSAPINRLAWDPNCYLCPRNARTSGLVNPDYRATFAFDNDFPALDAAGASADGGDLFRRETVTGRCRVLCYAPEHDRTLAELDDRSVSGVVLAWCEETALLAPAHDWVQVFENKGALMGASSPHPHGQIWASSVVPTIPEREDRQQRTYADVHRRPLLLDYAEREVKARERVVFANARWLAVVPFWAAWLFEVLLLPRAACSGFTELGESGSQDLAEVMIKVLRAYDRLFGVPFPYSMGWHGRGRGHGGYWQLHGHLYPPLLRSATVRKFMVGYEMLAETQRDLTPEAAATRLRGLVS